MEINGKRLLDASREGTLERVEALLQQGASVNYTDLLRGTPLSEAAGGGHLEVVNKLLDAGADVKVPYDLRGTLLHLAASGGHLEVVNKLLDAGADVKASHELRGTPLHEAARGGHLEVVNKLLDAGADINVMDRWRKTPLHEAARGGHLEVVNKLLDTGADINVMSRLTGILLHEAAAGGHLEVVNTLIDAGADINVIDEWRGTPLHAAAAGGHLEVVNKLLDAGADINVIDEFQKNLLHLAVDSGHLGVVKKVLGAGAAVKVTDSVPHMNNVLIVRSAKDCEELLARFREQSTLGPLPEVPYSLYILGRTSDEVINILRALPQDKNLEGLFVTNVIGELSLDKVFHWKYPSITKLTFINCGLQILPKDIDKHFPNAEELVLTNNDLRIIPGSVGNLSRLQVLRMSRNGLKVLPDTIGKLKNLKELYCVHNNLKTLPGTLSRLFDSLLRLDVRHNSISNLPTAITILLKRLLAFHCADNPLIKDLGSEKKNNIITYLEDLGNGTNNKLEVKLAVVGEEGVGKTTLVQALRTKRGICKGSVKKTNGIEINQLQIEDVTFKVFDTAGDADFLETHLLFTSPNCLYLHVYNIATMGIDERRGIQLGRLEMWLKSIFVQAPGSRNVIVGTHADSRSHSREMNDVIKHQIDSVLGKAQKAHSEQFQSNTVEDCYLCQGCPDAETLPSSIKEQSGKPCSSDTNLSEGNIPHVVGRHEVSSVKNYPAYIIDYIFGNRSIRKLKKLLVDKARKLLNDFPRTPRNWMDVLEVWRDTQGLPLLSKEEAQRIAKDYGITEHSKLCLMLSFFTNKGYIVYHEKVPDIIVLDPQWLADQLCRLISFKQAWIHDGLLKPEDLKKAFEGTDDRWQQEVIKLLRHFRICFPLRDGGELFPCRLPFGMPAHSLWPPIPETEDRQVSYMCQFSFVPNSLFPEIVVAVNEDPNVDKFPEPRFFCNRAIYQTREKHDSCHSCKDEPFQSYEKPHRVHLELSYPKNAVLVTVRGPRPCCIAKSMCGRIKSLAGENTIMKISPLCPKCVVQKVGDASRLIITPSKPANHIACKIGHQLGRQDRVLRGQLNFTPEPSTNQNYCSDDGNCPRFFVMLPINKEALSFMEYYTLLKDGFALHVLCEHPGEWHFLSTPGFRLPKLQDFIKKYGGRAYAVLKHMVKPRDSVTVRGPVSGHLFGENRHALERFLHSYDEKFPSMKKEAILVNLKKPTDTEDLKRSSLKKLVNISNDPDQPLFPDLYPVKVKNEVLWLCLRHAKSNLSHQSVAPMQEPIEDATQDSEESHMDMAGEYAHAEEDTSGQKYSDNRVASLEELDGLSWKIIPFWESLGRKLGVPQGTIDNLTYSLLHLQPHEKAFQLLKAWYDDGGTFRQLAQALKNLGREDLAEQYCAKQEDLWESQWPAHQTQPSSVPLISEDKVKVPTERIQKTVRNSGETKVILEAQQLRAEETKAVQSHGGTSSVVELCGTGHQPLSDVALQPKSYIVGRSGGKLSYYGCTVSIPEGALEEDTEVFLEMLNIDCPKLVVSPILKLEPSNLTFNCPVSVTLPIVVIPTAAAREDEWPVVTLMCFAKGEWGEVQSTRIASGKPITFECKHFSAYCNVIDKDGIEKVGKRLTCLLFEGTSQGKQSEVTVAICDDLEDVVEVMKKILRKERCSYICGEQTLSVESKENIKVHFTSDVTDMDIKVTPSEWVLQARHMWPEKSRKYKKFKISRCTGTHQADDIMCVVNSDSGDSVTMIYSLVTGVQDSEESQPNRAQEYAQAEEDTSGQEYSDNKVESLEELDGLSWKLIPFWESLGRKLGVPQEKIDDLAYSLIHLPPHEKAFQLLKAWFDDGGTYRQLAQALKNMGREDLAKQYCVKH